MPRLRRLHAGVRHSDINPGATQRNISRTGAHDDREHGEAEGQERIAREQTAQARARRVTAVAIPDPQLLHQFLAAEVDQLERRAFPQLPMAGKLRASRAARKSPEARPQRVAS